MVWEGPEPQGGGGKSVWMCEATAGRPQEAGNGVAAEGKEGWPYVGRLSPKPSCLLVSQPEGLRPGMRHKLPREKSHRAFELGDWRGCKEGR